MHVTPLGQGVPAPAPVVAFEVLVVPVDPPEPPSPEVVVDEASPPAPPSLDEPPEPVGSSPPGGEHAVHARRSQAEEARA